jgi:hypothetical protein
MKSSTIISTVGLYILGLTLIPSCQKQDEFNNSSSSVTSSSIPSYRVVNVDVQNWITNGDGNYRADFSDALGKAAGEYTSIAKVYEVNSSGDVEIQSTTSQDPGTLSRFGTLLIYHGQIPFTHLLIRVYVY